jgi:ADP-heptose:LPS heptosyltransferase
MMFSSSMAEIKKKNYSVELITGLNATNEFLRQCGYTIVYHADLRQRLSSLKIFLFLLQNRTHYEHVFITAGMSDLKLFILQFALTKWKNVSALAYNPSRIFLINCLNYDVGSHKTINNQRMVFRFLGLDHSMVDRPYFLPNNAGTVRDLVEEKSVIIHPGNDAKNQYRRYPIELYCKLIEQISKKKLASKIYIILGPGELNLESQFSEGVRLLIDSGFVILVRCPKFEELFRLFSVCRTFITNDSGLAHIAAAFSIHIINIYGPANPADTSPKSLNQTIIIPPTNLTCMPCVRPGGKHGCREQTCLWSISPDSIAGHIQ